MLLFSKASPHMSGKLTIKGEGARPAKGPHLRRWHLLAVALPLLHPRLHMRGHVCRLPVSLHSLGMVCLILRHYSLTHSPSPRSTTSSEISTILHCVGSRGRGNHMEDEVITCSVGGVAGRAVLHATAAGSWDARVLAGRGGGGSTCHRPGCGCTGCARALLLQQQ